MRAVRATRVSADAIAKAQERRERVERERADKERLEAERREKDKGLGEALFGVAKGGAFGSGGGGANPFAKPAAASAPNNPFSSPSSAEPSSPPPPPDADAAAADLPKTFAETLSLNNPQAAGAAGPAPAPEPWPAEADLPPAYPVSYLAEAEYETLDPQPAAAVPQAMDLDDSRGGGGKEDKDVFESTIDSTFQRFADRLAQNPDQCIRYEFGGQPLLYAKTDAVGRAVLGEGPGVPRCGGCGARRVFEVQMTPQAIVELEEDEGVVEGMDWGAVMVAVCEADCVPRGTEEGEVGYTQEWVGVQWEELTSRR